MLYWQDPGGQPGLSALTTMVSGRLRMPQLDPLMADAVQSTSLMLTWAMVWSQRFGIRVLPCNPDKSPRLMDGKLAATTEPGAIREWWTNSPDSLIGGWCDDLIVLDFDSYKDGHDADLSELGELPPTRSVHTPGRGGVPGRHLLYRGARRSGKLGRNKTVDVRGGLSRDYVILAPSTSQEGTYEVTSWLPLADAPEWLVTAPEARPVNVEGGLPALEPLPPTLRVMVPREADSSEHTYALIKQGLRMGLSPGQVRTLAEADSITVSRIAETRRQQPGWWPAEFTRCLSTARQELSLTRPVDDPYTYETDPPDTKETKGQRVMRIALRDYALVRSAENEVFGIPQTGPRVLHQLKGGVGSMRVRIAAQYEQEFGHSPSNTDLAELITVLEGKASLKPATELPMRSVRHGDSILLDLGDDTGRVIEICHGTWRLADVSPVPFRRTPLTSPLPVPVGGRKVRDTIYPVLNLPQEDRSLIVACALSWLWPDISHPVVYLHGEEGTAKSTMAKRLRSLVDPSIAELKRKPGRDEDWEVIVAGQSLVVLDNLGTLPEWLSDALCTAVTGTSDVKRRMYANQDLSVVSVRRSFIVTSVKQLIEHGDLVDRSIAFEPDPIEAFIPELTLNANWSAVHPYAVGALLDLAAAVLAELPAVRASWDGRERMADFAQICSAMDRVAGTSTLARYRKKIAEGIQSSVENNSFTVHVIKLAENNWNGTTASLFDTYRGRPDRASNADWPKSPALAGRQLERIRGVLRKSGVQIEKKHTRNGTSWSIGRIRSV